MIMGFSTGPVKQSIIKLFTECLIKKYAVNFNTEIFQQNIKVNNSQNWISSFKIKKSVSIFNFTT